MIALVLAAAATAVATPPAKPSGRVVDYALLTPEAIALAATDLKIKGVSPPPPRSTFDIAVEVGPAVDHQSLALGIYCSVYKVWNPAGAMLKALAAEADRDGVLGGAEGAPLLTIRLDTARSYRRCVEVKEMNSRCITRVTLSGEAIQRAADGVERRVPLKADVERDSSIDGICGGIARALGVITREAGQQLLAEALKPPA